MGRTKKGPSLFSWLARKVFLMHLILAIVLLSAGVVFWYYATLRELEARLAGNVVGQSNESGQPVYLTANISNNPSNARGLASPAKVAVDTVDHRLFVTDFGNNRILVYNLDANNNLLDRVADNVLGQPDFTSRLTSAGRAGMNVPNAVEYDSVGKRLFVIDSSNARVLVFDVSSITNGENAVNVLGQPDFNSVARTTTQSGFTWSMGEMAFNQASNTLFVADRLNRRVLVFDVTEITNGENAVAVLGQADFTSNSSATTQSGLSTSYGLSFDPTSNTLYVADSGNNRVLVYDVSEIENGENAVKVLGQVSFTAKVATTTQSGMNSVGSVSINPSNKKLYVGDSSNSRVLVFDVNEITDGENAVNVLGQPDFTSASYALNQSSMVAGPYGITVASNTLYVPTWRSNRIMIFDVSEITNGENAVDLLGQLDSSNIPVYTQDYFNNTPLGPHGFYSPYSIALDNINHRLFISDSGNNRILVFNLDSSNNLIDRAADNVLGQLDFASRGVGGVGTTTQSGLNNPYGLAYDAVNSRLFVADSLNRRVIVFDVASITNGENAVAVLGQTDFVSSDSATTQAGMGTVNDVEYDSANNRLFVADIGNRRVTVYDVSSISNGENANAVLGQADFVTVSAAVTQNTTLRPRGLAYNSASGTLFVFDEANRVLVFDVNTVTNGENAVNVLGQSDFTSSNPNTTANGLYSNVHMGGLDYDPTYSRLFIADYGNNRVVVYDVAEVTNGENAVAVIGQDDFVSATDFLTTQAGLRNPANVVFDSTNNRLYVAELSNHRVQIFDFIRLASTTLASPVYGVAYSQAVSTTNYQGTLSFVMVSGTLPAGLSLNTSTGYITGVPTATNTFTFTIRATETESTGSYSDTRTYSLTVGMPMVGFELPAVSDVESTASPTIQLVLSATSTNNITITMATSGAAVYGVDYVLSTTTLTISAGYSATATPLYILNNSAVEEHKSLTLTLISATNANTSTTSSLTYTILNDDYVVGSSPPPASSEVSSPSSTSSTLSLSVSSTTSSAALSFSSTTSSSSPLSSPESSNTSTGSGLGEVGFSTSSASSSMPLSATTTLSSTTTTLFTSTVSSSPLALLPTSSPLTSHTSTPMIASTSSEFLAIATTSSLSVASTASTTPTSTPLLRLALAATSSIPTPFKAFISSPLSTPQDYELCSNGADDDADGEIDCADADCVAFSSCASQSSAVSSFQEGPSFFSAVGPNTSGGSVGSFSSRPTERASPASSPAPSSFVLTLSDFLIFSSHARLLVEPQNGSVKGLAGTMLKISIPEDKVNASISIRLEIPLSGGRSLSAPFTQEESRNWRSASLPIPGIGRFTSAIILEKDNKVAQTLLLAVEGLPMGNILDYDSQERIAEVVITLYDAKGAVVPTEHLFNTPNPLKTTGNGAYGFIALNGRYYLYIEAPGYYSRLTSVFEVKDNLINSTWTLIKISPPLGSEIDPTAAPAVQLQALSRAVVRSSLSRVRQVNQTISIIIDDATVERRARTVVAPVAFSLTAAGVLPFITWADVLPLLRFLFLQPLVLLRARRGTGFGQVFNSLTRLPVDLCTVRLINVRTDQVVETQVTDKEGRYFFLARPGRWRLAASKSGWSFPFHGMSKKRVKSVNLAKGRGLDAYQGKVIEVKSKDSSIALPIALDTGVAQDEPIKFHFRGLGYSLESAVSLGGAFITALALLITPGIFLLSLLLLHVILYLLFKRLPVFLPAPKSFGRVLDRRAKQPLSKVFVRLFNVERNKLIATQFTDKKGRYSFLAGEGKYFVTFEREGFKPLTSKIIAFSEDKAGALAVDVQMQPAKI